MTLNLFYSKSLFRFLSNMKNGTELSYFFWFGYVKAEIVSSANFIEVQLCGKSNTENCIPNPHRKKHVHGVTLALPSVGFLSWICKKCISLVKQDPLLPNMKAGSTRGFHPFSFIIDAYPSLLTRKQLSVLEVGSWRGAISKAFQGILGPDLRAGTAAEWSLGTDRG